MTAKVYSKIVQGAPHCYASSLTCKYSTMVYVTSSEELTSLQYYSVNYKRKKSNCRAVYVAALG